MEANNKKYVAAWAELIIKNIQRYDIYRQIFTDLNYYQRKENSK